MKCPICGADVTEDDVCWVAWEGDELPYCFDCYVKEVNGELDDRINHAL